MNISNLFFMKKRPEELSLWKMFIWTVIIGFILQRVLR